MKKLLYLIPVILAVVISCNNHQVPDPVVNEFSANPTTLPRTDTVTYTIDAVADFIILFDGKTIVDLTDKEMPYIHKIAKMKSSVTAPGDTVYAKLALTNVYDSDNIKTRIDSIKIILLP